MAVDANAKLPSPLVEDLKEVLAPKTLGVQMFDHKGEMVVVFTQPVHQWFLTPAMARQFGEAMVKFADTVDAAAKTAPSDK